MDTPRLTLVSDGRPLPVTVLSAEVHRELNRIPEATVRVDAGRLADGDAATLDPGRPLVIAVHHEGKDRQLFEGLVVRHVAESRATAGSGLRVELKDAAFRLTRRRRSAVFRDQTDADTIRKLVGDAKLAVGQLAVAGTTHDEMIQFYASDWDFIVSRADAQGLVVDVRDGTVSVRAMVADARPRARLRQVQGGVDLELDDGVARLRQLELELDGGELWAELTGQAWDAQQLAATEPVSAAKPTGAAATPRAAAIARQLGGATGVLVHPALLPQGELKAWATSRLLRSRLAMLRGRVVIPGRPEPAPLDVLELEGMSAGFGSEALVSAVTHTIDPGGWRTELRLGLPPEPFARQPDIADLLAGGLLPPAQGLHVGVVAGFEKDPLGQHRVKILLSVLDPAQGAVWARVARPDAGDGRGVVFWPEPGDEVVVGFLNGDPRQAIVLGALHGPRNAPPPAAGPPSVDNSRRAIVSKRGVVIAFDDAAPSVAVETPGGNRIVIDDAAQSIVVADQHGNTIKLDANGITLTSASDLHLDAAGKVVIQGSEVDVQ